MQFSVILEVAIGLVVTWLILSVTTSQIQEFFVDLAGWRATFLRNQIREMFHGQINLVEIFYSHPLIQSLHTTGILGTKRKPKEIPASVFAKAAVDVFLNIPKLDETQGIRRSIHLTPAGSINYENLESSHKASIANLKQSPFAGVLNFLAPNLNVEAVETDKLLAEYQKNIEVWFETAMSKASELYKKNASLVALIIGFLLAYWFNVDSIYITHKLWAEPTLREAIIAQAGNLSPNDEAGLNSTISKINNLPLPIGWNPQSLPTDQQGWYLKYAGWFITGLAASQGSSFWFDVLRKLGGFKSGQSQSSPAG